MSSFWTPDGEHTIQPESQNDEIDPNVGEFDHLSPEDQERAEAMVKEMAAAQERIAQTPVAVVISTPLMGLYELAAIHLSQQPPNLKDASLAIDALGAVMDKLVNQLGESEETLKDALHQIRMAYVSLEQRDNMTSESEEGSSEPETT